ncbi:MAG: FAD-dependent oxidoreductase [Terriglobales bacterium]
MKTWDAIIVGGGIIGLSLALGLRKRGHSVVIVDRGEPGREASHAAGGMLAHCDPHTPRLLQPLALESAKLYPQFVHELNDESDEPVDYRTQGTILLSDSEPAFPCPGPRRLSADELPELEPGLSCPTTFAYYLPEAVLDPRTLVAAALKAVKHRGIDLVSGSAVTEITVANERATGVRTDRSQYAAAVVVNCAGAWAAQIPPLRIPTKPVKGQMLAVVPPAGYDAKGTPLLPHILTHVIRTQDVYVIPRSDGRIVIGSTIEDAGFDKRVDADTVQTLRSAAVQLVPRIGEAKMHETWAGLRPGTPDGLPILGSTAIEGHFVATGHYRDGILLAPVTAHLMTQVIEGLQPELDLSAFMLSRFE